MALIDTSELLSDPDFCDTVGLIRRTSTVGSNGRNTITEAAALQVLMSVQGLKAGDFVRMPDLVNFDGVIAVWYNGVLIPEGAADYSDIIVWNGKRYQVHKIDEDFSNFGGGFMKAFCTAENPDG